MKKKLFFFLFSLLCATGCVPVFIGVGVLTGYAISNDTAHGNLSVDYRDLWDVSVERFEAEGLEITQMNESKGIIKAVDGDTRLALKIDSLGVDLQRLKVSARKHFLPHPQVAQDLFFKIVQEFE